MHWWDLRLSRNAGSRNAVYAWPTAKGYYAEAVVPRVRNLRAKPRETAQAVLHRLKRDTTGFLFHLDLTDTCNFPQERERLVEELRTRGIRVWNAGLTNISKRAVHGTLRRLSLPSVLADRQGDAGERLMVKTDRNYGGRSEQWLSSRDRRALKLEGGSAVIGGAFEYRVMTRDEVPVSWWDDPELVIERFVENQEQRLHRVHVVLNRFAFWSGVSSLVIKKIRDCTDTREYFLRRGESHPDLPAALLRTVYQYTETFAMDFGAVDLVPDDAGCFYVIDANSTPWRGTESPERMAFLRAAWDDPA
jgi:hypothetical protein